MKLSLSTCILKALAFEAVFLPSTIISAMKMNNMLMGQPLDSFLSDLVSFGDMAIKQKQSILKMADDEDGDRRTDVFATEDSREGLRSYLYAQVSAGDMEQETAEIIASTLSLGGLYPSSAAADAASALLLNGPVNAVYDITGEGNMVRLGTSKTLVPDSTEQSGHNGIWGYATGQREYALQCHGVGFAIIDVTNPANTFRVQLVPMEGGGYWRDAATHFDPSTGKTFAYVGSQGTQGGGQNPNLVVFDLSYLSGDINIPDGIDSDPIPAGTGGYLNLGYKDLTHTINVARGLLFLNTARASNGCRVYDLTANPWNPSFLFNTGGTGRDCHDSFVRENIDGKDVLFVSDGSGRRERIYDITNVDANWSVNTVPPQIGAGTPVVSGIYAHECWLSEDNRYLFQFDENNAEDIIVHDVSDLANPVTITIFQYSEQGSRNALPHNGQVRGNYLYAAYYEAGLRVFDISNPHLPVEVGKVETHRDPDGDGNYDNGIIDTYEGAWNNYPFLPSGNILVNDMIQGLFIVRADSPYDAPIIAPTVSAQRDASDNVSLNWNAVQDARGYSVERSLDGTTYSVIAEHLVGNTYDDTSVGSVDAFYKVNAVNGEGVGTSTVVTSLVPGVTPTKSPTNNPTASPVLPGICSNNPGQRCSTVDQCCGAPASASSGNLFNGKLQDLCEGNKKKACTGSCTWVSGLCVGPALPPPSQSPTTKPTSSPSKQPTEKPTRSPTPCSCLLTTESPTPEPTSPPTKAPIASPSPPTTCLSKGSTCPSDPGDCCSRACEMKGRNNKCS
eukprot:CAMPEP_0202000898 /NCGR_PEP_ID=MMETSP0905-20130828/7147_1 /ASSEMBLY_ACC=CAM_ASM_000554 /TAXON_ID=420261 /ORGANISM="Thalassiosira antarctica, Strain CCMP982" /LENGTH=787 /DNA_ID=CAMNT_0048557497 /DNA_START=44 /DNA_END=2407 /DNA_ORIENTATION=+